MQMGKGRLEAFSDGVLAIITGPGPVTRGDKVTARLDDVVADPGEKNDVVAAHPAVVARLAALAAQGREHIGDLDYHGRGEHPAGWVRDPHYQVLKTKP